MTGLADTVRLRGLLERLEAHWRRMGAPIVRFLQPELTQDEMDRLTAPLGLRLPAEARVWYAWHDGVRYPKPHERLGGNTSVGAISYNPRPLATAVETCESMRLMDQQAAVREPEVYKPGDTWQHSWFPICDTVGGDQLVISCDVPDGAVTAVRPWNTESFGDRTAADSLTEVVEAWVHLLDEGLMHWDGERWRHEFHRIDPDLRRRAGY
jgi:cell wall assembly regulator SMI1